MKIADGIQLNLQVYDIETYKRLALFSFYNPDTKQWKEFEINKYRNDLYLFIKYYEDEKVDYHVSFNGIGFDKQVIEWVLNSYKNWFDKNGDEIAELIYDYANLVIDNSRHGIRGRFFESQFHTPELDLFKIWHYDRDERSTGLKKLEFSMDFPNIEELPISPSQDHLTEEEIEQIKKYCRNDIRATYKFLLYTIGVTEHSIYKGDNKIELRFSLKEEFNLESINISNTKIGDVIIRKEYSQFAKVSERDLPKKGFFRKKIPIKYCIPSYVKFQTFYLQQFLKSLKQEEITPDKSLTKTVNVGGREYTFGKGGIHAVNKGEYYQSDEEYLIIDLDVTSMYPWMMVHNLYAPYHLNKEAFAKALKTIVERRTELKPLAKKDKKIAGIVAGLKIAANSVYGFTNDVYSWVYDPLVTFQTTITGELSLLMLIEAFVENNINVISANTDGITIRIRRDRIGIMERLVKNWEVTTKLNMERVDYEYIVFSTVNDYIAVKFDDPKYPTSIEERIKVKGDFLQDSELHGDKSRRVVRLALLNYFVHKTPVEQFIKNHKNIYDFCIGVKSSENYHYELVEVGKTKSPLRELKNTDDMEKVLLSLGYWKIGSNKWLSQEIIDEAPEFTYEEEIALTIDGAIMYEISKFESAYGEREVLKKMVRYYISNKGRVLLKIKNPNSEAKGNPVSQVESAARVKGNYQPLVNYFNTYQKKDDYDINYDYYIVQTNNIINYIVSRKNKKGKIIEEDPNQLKLFQ